MKKRFISLSLAMTFFAMSLCGCTQKTEAPLVRVDSEEDIVSFNLIPVSYDDVVQTTKIDCTYVQTDSQEVAFDTTGKYVDKVYVKNGDYVKKGDLLCELSSDALEREIERLEYQIAKNELELSYYDTYEELEIQDAWVAVVGGNSNNDRANATVENIRESYARKRELMNDSLEFDRKELASKKRELKASRLYATMDGKVYKLKQRLEGSTSKAGDVLMTIVDDSRCLFEIKDTSYKDLFSDGTTVDMKIIYSTASGDYLLIPYDYENWTDSLLFSVYAGPDNAEIEVGVIGTITIGVETKEHVLSIPKETVHMAGDKAFVYTLNSENVREIRYVELGLYGDERVEILSGLSEGEKVVKK